ncbi:flagellar biosynthetic protein FlhB [Pacificibacter maritimus]|uniref:Flagellar biosynthetic protein FlhB n=1 Tax=Pacificibacter maritimus TaxID=762213 RepID=A0A3N4U284_9RHOB|nr:flagellar type III secretion system protein FlhB [Pacificibacter maritimus]RPE64622.1 flagellar biosynthetic protein FlhB [Pacificibacter maritimus]
MSQGEEDDDKQYEPSQKKLDDARKKGEIPQSVDLVTSAAYMGFIGVAAVFGGGSLIQLGTALQSFLEKSDTLSTEWFSGSGTVLGGGAMQAVFAALLPWFTLPALAAILVIIATKSLVFAPSKIEPKLNKISIISNAKNKYGRKGLFEFAKSFFKLSVYSIVLGVYLVQKVPDILATMSLSPGMVTVMLLELCLGFMLIVLVISMTIGGVDYMFQYSEHIRKHRMSRKELTDESKDQEGDPHFKQKRRQRAQEIALSQMLGDVPKADVIVVNPTHYAVALKWDRMRGGAPICVAKGVDDVAAKIREIANENSVPIHRDPPTARALYATIEIGAEIWPEHYKAVAASVRFAETMRAKMKNRFGA